MYRNCDFNEMRDISAVDQYGFVDLIECLTNGEVPSSISDTEMEYNEIDINNVLGKPTDVFDAYKMMDYVKTNGKSIITDQID
jgi:hypothetical protein